MLSGSLDKNIGLSDLRIKNPLAQTYSSHSQEVCNVQWSSGEDFFLSGGSDKKVYVWSVKSQVPIMKGSHEGTVKALCWSQK